MAFVSKHELQPEVEKQLYEQLADLFLANQRKKDCTNLIYELFTKTERLMFAKRIAIIALLERNYTPYSISLALQVSESTVARIDAKRSQGKYTSILKTTKNRQYRLSMLGTLEALLTLGFPGVVAKKARAQMRKDIESWRAGA
ncbi:MAG: hypothetical protein JKX80_00560 [Candidatus Pacebacteria bacterium]|nr:hypothetical protein [Candidatus Paceibacterota bacterium]